MSSVHSHNVVADAAATTLGGKLTAAMTHGGAAVSVAGGLTLNEWAIVVGIAVSIVGLIGNMLITWHWKRQHHNLERERHEWDKRRHERREGERRGRSFGKDDGDGSDE
jgi:hypothetical protein